MNRNFDVAVLVGSLRSKSLNRMLAHTLASLAPTGLSLDIVGIADLPFYNDDLEPGTPAPWQAIRQRVARADALLLVSPEYNRSVPAVLKNALDVLSRPYGKSALAGKPAAVITSSPGAMGGFGANHHLRQTLVGVGAKTMAAPEAYVGAIHTLFDEQGRLTNAATQEFMQEFLQALHGWTATVLER
jgi:chromate reductase